jgi:hypothetical protein
VDVSRFCFQIPGAFAECVDDGRAGFALGFGLGLRGVRILGVKNKPNKNGGGCER